MSVITELPPFCSDVEAGLVSVVIPTYRRPQEVLRAVETALAQTYRALEVIVVSDGVHAETRAILEGMDSRLRYYELAQNSGPAEARNVAVRLSCGEWIAFLDDDDEMMPTKIEHQMRLADRAQPKRMIACRVVYRHGVRDDIHPERPIGADEDVADYILLRPGCCRGLECFRCNRC
ncbi:glycosyltransferase family 2 protein [Granulicella cerasi]|uniref:Glycosyltransferase family 2 protein n=1 Tax=Granulicella cerasi TaxID=741063 RepID=A0ABW1Z7P8_9BACT